MTSGKLTAVGEGKGLVGGQLSPRAFLRREERDGAEVGGEAGSREGSLPRMGAICMRVGRTQQFFKR